MSHSGERCELWQKWFWFKIVHSLSQDTLCRFWVIVLCMIYLYDHTSCPAQNFSWCLFKTPMQVFHRDIKCPNILLVQFPASQVDNLLLYLLYYLGPYESQLVYCERSKVCLFSEVLTSIFCCPTVQGESWHDNWFDCWGPQWDSKNGWFCSFLKVFCKLLQAISKANASHNFWKLGFIDLSAECWQLLVLEMYRNTFNK